MAKDLKSLCYDRYGDDDLAAWVCAQVEKAGTADEVLRGDFTLPHPLDARKAMDRERGVAAVPAEPTAQHAFVGQLQARLAALESVINDKLGPALSDCGKRLAALEAHVTAPQGH